MTDTNAQQAANPTSAVQGITTQVVIATISGLGGGIIAGLVNLVIEYHTGLFQKTEAGETLIAPPIALWMILLYLATLATTVSCAWVQFNRHLHYREQYAVLLLIAVLTLLAAGIFSVFTGMLPWHLGEAFRVAIGKASEPAPRPSWAEYLVAGALFAGVYTLLHLGHSRWAGLKTMEQYQASERQEPVPWPVEAWREFIRMVRFRPGPELYHPEDPFRSLPPLEVTADYVPWREEAKELVALAFPAFSFADADWDNSSESWIGRNVDTDLRVLLHPCQERPTPVKLEALRVHAAQLSIHRVGVPVSNVLVAVYEAKGTPLNEVEGVQVTTRSQLLDRLLPRFDNYFAKLRERIQITRLPDSVLTLEEVYVPSELITIDQKQIPGTLEHYLDDWLVEPGRRHLALLGEYGQGKSTATQMWAFRMLKELRSSVPRRIPILLELRGKSPRNSTPLGLLGDWGSQYGIDGKTLWHLHRNGRLVLIFEGFDEMSLVGDRELRLRHFRTLWQFAHPETKILITGRPNFFLDDKEMKAALGIDASVGDNPYCEAFRLMPFTPTQINAALRNAPPLVRSQVSQLATDKSHFRELVSRPSILHVVSCLWEDEKLAEKVDQLTSAYVMGLFIDKSYRRQGEKEGPGMPGFSGLTTPERKYFMTGVAAYMGAKRLPNTITGDELNRVIDHLLDVIPDAVSTGASLATGETLRPLRERVKANPQYGRETVRTDVRTCCLLVDDPASPGQFRFAHKSILEYLFGEVIYRKITSTNDLVATVTTRAVNAGLLDLDELPVSIQYFAELYQRKISDSEDAQKLITQKLIHQLIGQSLLRRSVALSSLAGIMCISSSRSASPWLRPLLIWLALSTSLAPIGLLALLSSLFLGLYVWILPGASPHENVATSPWRLMMLLFGSLVLVAMTFWVRFSTDFATPQLARIQWRIIFRILHSYGIPNSLVHRALGTYRIPWLRNQNFYDTLGNLQ